jgi:hypothetical protein
MRVFRPGETEQFPQVSDLGVSRKLDAKQLDFRISRQNRELG